MQAWSHQQTAVSAAACIPSMLRQATLCSCGTSGARRLPDDSNGLTSRARRPLPKPPCGETRSANRTRWAGSGEMTAVAAPTAPAPSDLDTAQLPQRNSAVSQQPRVSAVDAVASQGAAERDPLGTPVDPSAVQPPLATGNEAALSLPATPEDAASLVLTSGTRALGPLSCPFLHHSDHPLACAGMGCGSDSEPTILCCRPPGGVEPASCAGDELTCDSSKLANDGELDSLTCCTVQEQGGVLFDMPLPGGRQPSGTLRSGRTTSRGPQGTATATSAVRR